MLPCAAGVCDAELDWSMALADDAGNGRVRKPTIGAMKAVRHLSQALGYTSPAIGFDTPGSRQYHDPCI